MDADRAGSKGPHGFSSGAFEPVPHSEDVISPELALVDPELRRLALDRERLREQAAAFEVFAAARPEPVRARAPLPPRPAPTRRHLFRERLPIALAAVALVGAAAFLAIAIARSLGGREGTAAVPRTAPQQPVARTAPGPAARAAKPLPVSKAAAPAQKPKAKRPARVLPKRPARVAPKRPGRVLPKTPARGLPKTTKKAASLLSKLPTATAPGPGSFRPSRAWFWQAVPGAIAYDIVFVRGSKTVHRARTKVAHVLLRAGFRFLPGKYRMEVTATVRRGGGTRKVTAAKVAFTVGRS